MDRLESQGDEKGVALVIVMTFLLILSLLAVSGLESALLESGMVASHARTVEILSYAEYGLRVGEEAVIAAVTDGKPLDMGAVDLFYPVVGGEMIDPANPDWSRIPQKGSDVHRGVEYVIQYAGEINMPVTEGSARIGMDTGLDSGKAHYFIVTAKAGQGRTVRIVQSVFVTSSAP